jgi:DNA-3-methyladenine glycosylase
MRKLPARFYNRPTIEVAIDLLGCRFVSNIGGVKAGGIIVETEAYVGEDDPACHAFRGPTKRNRIMYTMSRRRGTKDIANISSGPGKLTKAQGVTTEHNGTDLRGNIVSVLGPSENTDRIMASPRIGIGQGGSEKLWRFFLRDSSHVSRGSAFNKKFSYDLKYAKKTDFSIESELNIN